MQGDWRTSPVWQTSWTPNRLLHIPIFPTGSSAWILPLNRCLFHATHFNNLWGCLIQIFIAVDAFFLYAIIRPHERVLCIGFCKEWKFRLLAFTVECWCDVELVLSAINIHNHEIFSLGKQTFLIIRAPLRTTEAVSSRLGWTRLILFVSPSQQKHSAIFFTETHEHRADIAELFS